MHPLAERLAVRYLRACAEAFKVGDHILMGKWKNQRGIIVRLFEDAKGNPSIEVEPVPKGRKQNKIMGLYRIWHDPPPALRPPAG